MKVIRWIAVLPASILALFLVSIFLKFSMSFSGLETDSIISQCFIGVACGVAFIYAGVSVAPSHKVKVAFSLMIIGVLLSLVSLYAVNFVYFTYKDNFREVFAIIGSITTYVGVKGAKGNLQNM